MCSAVISPQKAKGPGPAGAGRGPQNTFPEFQTYEAAVTFSAW